jgi:hypothetical protein
MAGDIPKKIDQRALRELFRSVPHYAASPIKG